MSKRQLQIILGILMINSLVFSVPTTYQAESYNTRVGNSPSATYPQVQSFTTFNRSGYNGSGYVHFACGGDGTSEGGYISFNITVPVAGDYIITTRLHALTTGFYVSHDSGGGYKNDYGTFGDACKSIIVSIDGTATSNY